MTLEQARLSIGRTVVYRPFSGAKPETGVISSVSESGRYVFVRYADGVHTMATPPECLELVAQGK